MKKVNLDEEVALMLDELLNTEAFQQALNIASNHLGMPIDRFDELKKFLPEGTPFTMERVNEALQNYRANIIVETRKRLSDLSRYIKDQKLKKDN